MCNAIKLEMFTSGCVWAGVDKYLYLYFSTREITLRHNNHFKKIFGEVIEVAIDVDIDVVIDVDMS